MTTKKKIPGKRRRMIRRVLTAVGTVLLVAGFLCLFSAFWYVNTYGDTGFDSILFTLLSDLGGVETDLVISFALCSGLPALVCAAVTAMLIFGQPRKRRKLYPLGNGLAIILAVILSLGLMAGALVITEGHLYIYDMFHESMIFEEKYVDPNSVEITFPEEKRNLIYIFLESMETSYFSKDQGGALETNVIPELYDLARENLNFSQSGDVGGFRAPSGSTWTIGAMVSQTSGIPLKTPADLEDWQNGYGEDGEFLPGVTNLSDILQENGYNQALMVGSVCSFGGRKVYYQTHGTDTIFELSTARKDGIVPKDYFVWWGIEDKYLFQYAKQELTEMAAEDQPFAFTMLTVDTHHIGGYVCEYCGDTYEEQYENVMACASKQVAEFVDWIQEQDFYENTTVIIVGDHPSMDNGYFDRNVPQTYIRRMYNCFINPAAEADYPKNRKFTSLDLFPTTLGALGCDIEGDRLGLGTNLFSGRKTLAEVMGFDRLDRALSQNSDFYAVEFRLEEPEETEG